TTQVGTGFYSLTELQGMQFQPVENANGGPSGFVFRIQDSGGTANGGVDFLNEFAQITITPVNDLPVATGNTVIASEDVPLVIGPGDFNFTDTESDPLASVTITGLNLNGGTLTHSAGAVNVTNGMTVTAAQLADLTFTSALNDSTNSSFTYTVNDAGLGVTSAVMNITVNAVNVSPTLADQSFTLAENSPNGFSVGTIAFNDLDASDNHTFNITGGTGSTAFNINSTTGEITVAESSILDFELNPVLTLTVQITDDGTPALSASATITIGLTDIAEFDVSAVYDSDTTVNTVSADSPIGSAVGITVIANDADASDTVTYSLDDDAGGLFAIDSTTGIVTLNAPLNAQAAKSHAIVARAASTDGSASTQAFNIEIQNSNNNSGNSVVIDTDFTDDADSESSSPPLYDADPDIIINLTDGSEKDAIENTVATSASNGEERFDRRRSGGGSGNARSDDAVTIVVETTGEHIGQVVAELTEDLLIPTESVGNAENTPILVNIKATETQPVQTRNAALAMDVMALNGVLADHALWEQLEKMQQQMSEISPEEAEHELIVKIVTGSTLTVSAGFVSWMLRGGTLLASFLSTLPLWKGFDPLPILATREKKAQEKQYAAIEDIEEKHSAVSQLFQTEKGQLQSEPGTRT
ncbi:MAG: cadherin domain-containing protein, partial [Pseudomonadales bacterium]